MTASGHSPSSVAADAERAYAAAVRALLQGRPAAAPVDALPGQPAAELEERIRDGDADARLLLRARGALGRLPQRVELALAAEVAPVLLADGSSLTLERAERLLASKEEAKAHRALRASVDAALAPFQHFQVYRSERLGEPLALWLEDASSQPEPGGPDRARKVGAPKPETLRELVEQFVAETVSLRDAALDVLAVVGRERPSDPASLARALDLPDADGAFGEAVVLELLHAAREVARPMRSVGRFRCPRAMAGIVLDDGEIRFGQPPGVARFARFSRVLASGVAAVVRAREASARAPGLEVEAHAAALTLGLLSAPSLRRTANLARASAERVARVTAAVGVLRTRALALLLLHAPAGADEARDVLSAACGVDVGPTLTAALTQRPWRCDDDLALDVLARLTAPSLALTLRDELDETYALEAAAWSEAIPMDAQAVRRGWLQFAGELF